MNPTKLVKTPAVNVATNPANTGHGTGYTVQGKPPKVFTVGVRAGRPDPSIVLDPPTHGEIVAGYAYEKLISVALGLGITPTEMAERIGVSRSTFHRKQKTKALLSGHESDALARHGKLLIQALEVFDGDSDAAKQWLNCPQPALANQIPLNLAKTTFGFREVEKLLTRIDHGVYA